MLSQCFLFLIREFLSCWISQLAFNTNVALQKKVTTLCLIVFMLFSLNQASTDNLDHNKRLFHGRYYFNSFYWFFLLNCFHLLTSQLICCYESTYNMFAFVRQKCIYFILFGSRFVDKKYYLNLYSILFHKFLFIYKISSLRNNLNRTSGKWIYEHIYFVWCVCEKYLDL